MTVRLISRFDTKWRFKIFAKYDYIRFLLDVIIAIIVFALAIIVIIAIIAYT
jgi:hypothetical protein